MTNSFPMAMNGEERMNQEENAEDMPIKMALIHGIPIWIIQMVLSHIGIITMGTGSNGGYTQTEELTW